MPDLQLIPRMDELYTHCFQKLIEKTKKKLTSQQVLRKRMDVLKNAKTKMTAMPRSMDSNGRSTILYWQNCKNRGIDKKLVLHHASLFLSLKYWTSLCGRSICKDTEDTHTHALVRTRTHQTHTHTHEHPHARCWFHAPCCWAASTTSSAQARSASNRPLSAGSANVSPAGDPLHMAVPPATLTACGPQACPTLLRPPRSPPRGHSTWLPRRARRSGSGSPSPSLPRLCSSARAPSRSSTAAAVGRRATL